MAGCAGGCAVVAKDERAVVVYEKDAASCCCDGQAAYADDHGVPRFGGGSIENAYPTSLFSAAIPAPDSLPNEVLTKNGNGCAPEVLTY